LVAEKAGDRLLCLRGSEKFEKKNEHLTIPADIHFLFPVFLRLALADGAVDEPA
jgi:hypothetical protein